jgi:hypothetical protein
MGVEIVQTLLEMNIKKNATTQPTTQNNFVGVVLLSVKKTNPNHTTPPCDYI